MSETGRPLSEAVADAWERAFGIDGIAPDDDFFDLGGDSMVAAKLAGFLGEELGAEVPLLAVFDHPTVAGLTAELEATRDQRN